MVGSCLVCTVSSSGWQEQIARREEVVSQHGGDVLTTAVNAESPTIARINSTATDFTDSVNTFLEQPMEVAPDGGCANGTTDGGCAPGAAAALVAPDFVDSVREEDVVDSSSFVQVHHSPAKLQDNEHRYYEVFHDAFLVEDALSFAQLKQRRNAPSGAVSFLEEQQFDCDWTSDKALCKFKDPKLFTGIHYRHSGFEYRDADTNERVPHREVVNHPQSFLRIKKFTVDPLLRRYHRVLETRYAELQLRDRVRAQAEILEQLRDKRERDRLAKNLGELSPTWRVEFGKEVVEGSSDAARLGLDGVPGYGYGGWNNGGEERFEWMGGSSFLSEEDLDRHPAIRTRKIDLTLPLQKATHQRALFKQMQNGGRAGQSFLQNEKQKLDYKTSFFEIESHPPILFDPDKVAVDDYFEWHNLEHFSQLENWKQDLMLQRRDHRKRQKKAQKTLEAATRFLRYRGLVDDEWASSFLLTSEGYKEKQKSLLELKHALTKKPGVRDGWLAQWADHAKESLRQHKKGRVMGRRGISSATSTSASGGGAGGAKNMLEAGAGGSTDVGTGAGSVRSTFLSISQNATTVDLHSFLELTKSGGADKTDIAKANEEYHNTVSPAVMANTAAQAKARDLKGGDAGTT